MTVRAVGGSAIRRLRRRGGGDVAPDDAAYPPDDAVYPPVDDAHRPVDEPTFVCSSCRREMVESERSKVAIGRCRACV
jgi:hypothetical protein